MCQRKIIGKGRFEIVPLLNGCDCPEIKQIRDIDQQPEPPPPPAHKCRDIKTAFSLGQYPVSFRFCKCYPPDADSVGPCRNLKKKFVVSPMFADVNLQKEFWTEDASGLTYERDGMADPPPFDTPLNPPEALL